jgi:hypothetical protein
VFLIANAAPALPRWGCAEREGPRSKLETLPTEKVSREAEHEDSRKIEKGTPDGHREVDAQDFVLATMEALSTRAVAPPPGKHFATNAYQNSSQSRVHGINHSADHPIEHRRRRVFPDPTRNNHHRPARRHVLVGETLRQARES